MKAIVGFCFACLGCLITVTAARAATVYVCGTPDYRATYGAIDVNESVARRDALHLCRTISPTPRACGEMANCKAFPNKKPIHAEKIVPFPHPLHPPVASHRGSASGSGSGSQESPVPAATPEPTPTPVHRQCDNDSQCPGFANHCFAGRCTAEGYQCDSDSQCKGFANHCFAGKCTVQEAGCDSDADCPGFANHCFASKCTNP